VPPLRSLIAVCDTSACTFPLELHADVSQTAILSERTERGDPKAPLEIAPAPLVKQSVTGGNRRQSRNTHVTSRHGLTAESSQTSPARKVVIACLTQDRRKCYVFMHLTSQTAWKT